MATVLCVLYPDPVDGYPPRYVRDAMPVITRYADGQTAPTPAGPPGFRPGELVDSVSGALGAGRIGLAVLRRLHPFGLPLHYTQRHRLDASIEQALALTYHADAASLASAVDIVNLQIPLYPSTEHLFDAAMIARMKRGAHLINTARAKLVDRDAVVNALTSGHLAGYGGDVWFPQPAPADHPWRTMPFNGMTPHISGTSLSAQARYAAGTLEILQCWFDGRPIRNEYLIVDGGTLAGTGAQSYRLT
ncbi:6-phosphogluconate dehydrogenase [Burkholderia sp. MS389]|uniref:NAD(P)-dependent oxidoreductase n=1 Tax=Burkholderia sp. MS389 TaxID=2811789 RepID=UPI00195D8034|nr:NAD(P)-dependent oxidoreductase [Burkholderia sp. MS389]QRR18379.1 6-phosphogluconate dehydrogenase [Burkholderia sp. MS389]